MRRMLALVVLMAVVVMPAPAGAKGAPLTVTIVAPLDLNTGTGPFTASGAAVEAGVVCASGTFENVFTMVSGGSPAGVNFQVVHRFTCADSSGTFALKLQVRLDQRGDIFQWQVVGGTDAYAGLIGNGSGVGVADGDMITDTYVGQMH